MRQRGTGRLGPCDNLLMAVGSATSTRRARLRELAIALAIATMLLVGALVFVSITNGDGSSAAVGSTLRRVKADAAPIRAARWDQMRAASLLGTDGGIGDAFKDVGRPNHVTYGGDVITVEFRTGADTNEPCVTAKLRRESATFAETRCSPSGD
jgi:hypothetical protein